MEARHLITAEQIRRRAREEKLAAGVIEKDYAITWLLRGIYQENSGLKDILVLKGGTAIRKVYFPAAWRFSEDLDFTTIGSTGAEEIRKLIQQVFEVLLGESGIDYSLESFHIADGAAIANAQFYGPLNFPNRIRHDITLKEKMVLEPQWRPIKTRFSDLPEFKVLTYSLDEILAEKIRSIMQRGYSRDYYDVWRLLKEKEFKDSEIEKLLKKEMRTEQDRVPTRPVI